MLSNRLAFAALAVACIAAAAGGGYLASRQNAVPAPAAAMSAPAPAPVATAPAEKPVQETEALVGDNAARKATSPTNADESAPAPQAVTSKARRSEQIAKPGSSRRPQTMTASASQQQPPSLTTTWPSSAAGQLPQPPASPAGPMTGDGSAPQRPPVTDEYPAQEPPRPPEPPQKTFEELVVSANSVIGLQMENRISSETAKVEDRVEARVTRDVRVGDRVAIPAGARVIGSVTQVERGGKFKEQARLGIRFHTIVMADGTRMPISTDTIVRQGEAPTNGTAAKIGGGAVGGAIIGAILGGGKGAAIGAAAGGGAGSAMVAAGDRSTVVVAPGTALTARILQPVTVTVEK